MRFGFDGGFALIFSLFFLLLFISLWRWKKRQPTPHLSFSKTEHLSPLIPSNMHLRLNLPTYCKYLALTLFLLAYLNPHLNIPKPWSTRTDSPKKIHPLPIEGAAFYLVLDHSGSMKETIFATTPDGKDINTSKIRLLKDVTKKFIQGDVQSGLRGRGNDLIGLVSFARTAKVLSPLTLDHTTLLHLLAKIDTIDKEEQDGTALGYAIFKTANLIDATRKLSQEAVLKNNPTYHIKNAAIILLTDGFQYPNPLDEGNRLRNMDIEEAAHYAKEKDIKLYIINIDPRMAESKFTPIRNQMERLAELTGGKYYLFNDRTDLHRVYADIDKLEKSHRQTQEELEIAQESTTTFAFFPYLISAGLLILASGIFLESFIWRQVP
jgi:Ca-activated chloride channel family protein